MLDDLVKNIIEINLDNEINFNIPINELIGLKITLINKTYDFIIKLSKDNKNLILICNNEDKIQTIPSKSIPSFLNQEQKINKLNEELIKNQKKISKIKSTNDFKMNMLNNMIINKDSALISLTNKIEKLTNENEKLDVKASELSKLIKNKDSKIKMLINDFNKLTQEYETQMNKLKFELNLKNQTIEELNENIGENKVLIEEINILSSTIEVNNATLESKCKEIKLLKEIISEKDRTIDSLNSEE